MLEIDVQKQQAIASKDAASHSDKGKPNEDALSVAKRNAMEQRQKAEDRFRKARNELSKSSDRLDALFRDAIKKAEEEDPVDLDGSNPFKSGKVWD
jgi:hypothetical protein